jgi:hypothetical protein
VVELGSRRGPASEAQALYEDLRDQVLRPGEQGRSVEGNRQ